MDLEKMNTGILKVVGEGTKSDDGKSEYWEQSVEIDGRKRTINYYAYIVYPICEVYDEAGKRVYDEYKNRISEGLEKRGWKGGMMGLLYKEKIPFTEILDCIAFVKAYRESYEFLTNIGGHFIDVPIRAESFLELVDAKTKIEREHGPLPVEMTWKNLGQFLLRTMKFKFVSFDGKKENK